MDGQIFVVLPVRPIGSSYVPVTEFLLTFVRVYLLNEEALLLLHVPFWSVN